MKTYRFKTTQTLEAQYLIQVPDNVELREEDIVVDLEKYVEDAIDFDIISHSEEFQQRSLCENDRRPTSRAAKRNG